MICHHVSHNLVLLRCQLYYKKRTYCYKEQNEFTGVGIRIALKKYFNNSDFSTGEQLNESVNRLLVNTYLSLRMIMQFRRKHERFHTWLKITRNYNRVYNVLSHIIASCHGLCNRVKSPSLQSYALSLSRAEFEKKLSTGNSRVHDWLPYGFRLHKQNFAFSPIYTCQAGDLNIIELFKIDIKKPKIFAIYIS